MVLVGLTTIDSSPVEAYRGPVFINVRENDPLRSAEFANTSTQGPCDLDRDSPGGQIRLRLRETRLPGLQLVQPLLGERDDLVGTLLQPVHAGDALGRPGLP